jgi:hypothetical protein
MITVQFDEVRGGCVPYKIVKAANGIFIFMLKSMESRRLHRRQKFRRRFFPNSKQMVKKLVEIITPAIIQLSHVLLTSTIDSVRYSVR